MTHVCSNVASTAATHRSANTQFQEKWLKGVLTSKAALSESMLERVLAATKE